MTDDREERRQESVLTDAEVRQLVLATMADGRTASEADFRRAVLWAEGVRQDEALLSMVLDGKVGLTWHDGEDVPRFWAARGAERGGCG